MQSLILLHGALGAPDTLQPLAAQLQDRYRVYCPAFPGHGGVAAARYTMGELVHFLRAYIAEEALQKPLLFGYSMGGYVALSLAAESAGLVGAVATLATKLHWTPEGATQESRMLDPEKLEAKVPAYAEVLRRRHAPLDWKEVLRGTALLMQDLGARPLLHSEAYARITDPVLLLLGDSDAMVSLDETREVFLAIRGAQLGLLPGTPHPLEKVPVDLLAAQLHHFYKNILL